MSARNGVKLRLVDESDAGGDAGGRSRLQLSRPDWIALSLLALLLVLAPLGAGQFASPIPQDYAPESTLDWLHLVAGLPTLLLLAAGALWVLVGREWQRPVAIGAVPGLAGAGLLLTLWAGLTCLRSPVKGDSLNALSLLLVALLAGTLVSRLARDVRAAQTLVFTLAGAGAFVAVWGANEYLGYAKIGQLNHRTFSTFINPDFTAGYLLLTLPVTLAAFAAYTRLERLPRLLLGLSLLLQSACLLLTGSRTAVVALAIGVGVWLGLTAYTGSLRANRNAIVSGLLVLFVGALLGFGPTLNRVTGAKPAANTGTSAPGTQASGAGDTGHSGSFRRYTWQGTVRTIQANTLTGTGLGTWRVAYPRYSITAYTGHAHNSFLQWASDTGLPGLALLLAALAAATAFAARVLQLQHGRARAAWEADGEEGVLRVAPAVSSDAAATDLLLCGLLASLAASGVKSFVDSDWFLVPVAVTLAVVLGLIVALARDLAPLATNRPTPLSRPMLGVSALVGAFLLLRGVQLLLAQSAMLAGFQAQSEETRATAFADAAQADPLNPHGWLLLASAYGRRAQAGGEGQSGSSDAERDALQTAVRVAPIGETYYRLGRFLAAHNDPLQAIAALSRSRDREPHNLQTLNALGETYRTANENDLAIQTFQEATDLEGTPYGKVRAVPETPETEFSRSHARLSEIYEAQGRWPDVRRECEGALNILREYWPKRNGYDALSITPAKREALAVLYEDTLKRYLAALQNTRADADTITSAQAEQTQVAADHQQDLAAQSAGSP